MRLTGTSSTTFDVVTRDDAYADNGEEFTASITGSTGGGYENLVVGTGSVTTEIQDQTGSDSPPGVEDTTTLNITGPASTGVEDDHHDINRCNWPNQRFSKALALYRSTLLTMMSRPCSI